MSERDYGRLLDKYERLEADIIRKDAEIERLKILHANAKHWEAHWMAKAAQLSAALRTASAALKEPTR